MANWSKLNQSGKKDIRIEEARVQINNSFQYRFNSIIRHSQWLHVSCIRLQRTIIISIELYNHNPWNSNHNWTLNGRNSHNS